MSEHASFSRNRTVRCVCGTSGWGEIAPTDDVAVRHLEFRTGPTGGGAREPVIAGQVRVWNRVQQAETCFRLLN